MRLLLGRRWRLLVFAPEIDSWRKRLRKLPQRRRVKLPMRQMLVMTSGCWHPPRCSCQTLVPRHRVHGGLAALHALHVSPMGGLGMVIWVLTKVYDGIWHPWATMSQYHKDFIQMNPNGQRISLMITSLCNWLSAHSVSAPEELTHCGKDLG